jgi:hypothetical protein
LFEKKLDYAGQNHFTFNPTLLCLVHLATCFLMIRLFYAGVAALVTMGLVFRKFINKKKVAPQNDENKNSVSELSWT